MAELHPSLTLPVSSIKRKSAGFRISTSNTSVCYMSGLQKSFNEGFVRPSIRTHAVVRSFYVYVVNDNAKLLLLRIRFSYLLRGEKKKSQEEDVQAGRQEYEEEQERT